MFQALAQQPRPSSPRTRMKTIGIHLVAAERLRLEDPEEARLPEHLDDVVRDLARGLDLGRAGSKPRNHRGRPGDKLVGRGNAGIRLGGSLKNSNGHWSTPRRDVSWFGARR